MDLDEAVSTPTGPGETDISTLAHCAELLNVDPAKLLSFVLNAPQRSADNPILGAFRSDCHKGSYSGGAGGAEYWAHKLDTPITKLPRQWREGASQRQAEFARRVLARYAGVFA